MAIRFLPRPPPVDCAEPADVPCFYLGSPKRDHPMFEQRKKELLSAWRELATQANSQMDPEQQYDELLKAADKMEAQGLISSTEWRQLVRDAGSVFTKGIGRAQGQ